MLFLRKIAFCRQYFKIFPIAHIHSKIPGNAIQHIFALAGTGKRNPRRLQIANNGSVIRQEIGTVGVFPDIDLKMVVVPVQIGRGQFVKLPDFDSGKSAF